jgi:predicted GIY-YIG superfamily endonuclease
MPRIAVGRTELETRPHILYRFYDRTGALLYIGITVDFADRMKDHAKEKEWWARVDRSATKVEYYDSRRAALDAERDAIKDEHPLENDQHNEWLEVDSLDLDEPWSVDAFVGEILKAATETELDVVMHDERYDFSGGERTTRGRQIAAAFSLLIGYMWDRERLKSNLSTLREMLKLATDSRWKDFFDGAPTDGEARHEPDDDQEFIVALAAAKAAEYLDSLSGGEGDGWRECGYSIEGRKTPRTHAEISAATYANLFHTKNLVRNGLCQGPHPSGSRCPGTDLTETVFEVCPICENGMECSGHRVWCEKHASMAWHGRLAIFDHSQLTRFPIKGSPASRTAA